jgi:mRNA (2'-O-methyladenosine-N6-)-methyltransferase
MNSGLDSDVIVAEVRATSRKPDEIYGMIERLSPRTRKVELFGRPHNVQPNWITLGNQLDGVRLIEPDVVRTMTSSNQQQHHQDMKTSGNHQQTNSK